MAKERVVFQNKPHWRPSAGEEVGQSSHDEWKSSKHWKEISVEMDASGSAVKEKTNTWTKNCKESAKRESYLYKMVELAAIDERQEDKRKKYA